jgi:quercetin dioxygenase-like cupin family protein
MYLIPVRHERHEARHVRGADVSGRDLAQRFGHDAHYAIRRDPKGGTMPVITDGTLPDGNLRGEDHGASISLILDESDPGGGPRLHRHPYDETWVVIEGALTFQAGDEQLAAGPGDIVIVPPDTPHRFTNDGPGRSRLVCIHAHPRFDTEWLE